jgi:organic hydroperoxide reductase OsmC/OhrA
MDIPGSSDPAFRGDPSRHNPEDLLLASLSACHMLWYLHLCAEAGIVVTSYHGHATGLMEDLGQGGGCFKEVTLNPEVVIDKQAMYDKAVALHQKANALCFIANSVNFPVKHKVMVTVET